MKQPETDGLTREEIQAEFLNWVLPDAETELGANGRYCLQVFRTGGRPFAQAAADPWEFIQAVNRHDDHKSNDRHAWYSPAVFDCSDWTNYPADDEYEWRRGKPKPERTADCMYCAAAFWYDLDGDAEAQAAELERFLQASNAAAHGVDCLLVHSGGGLHCYFPLEESVLRHDWKIRAGRLVALAAKFNLDIDAAVTTDEARVLRLPETYNRKEKYAPNYPKAQWFAVPDRRNTLAGIDAWLDAAGVPANTTDRAAALVPPPVAPDPATGTAADRIYQGCKVMQDFHANDAPEHCYEMFIQTLSNLAFADEPERRVEAVFPRYTANRKRTYGADMVAARVRQWRERPKLPYGCRRMRAGREHLCTGCPLDGQPGARPLDLARLSGTKLRPEQQMFRDLLTQYTKGVAAEIGAAWNGLEHPDCPVDVQAWDAGMLRCFSEFKENKVNIFTNDYGRHGRITADGDLVRRLSQAIGNRRMFRPRVVAALALGLADARGTKAKDEEAAMRQAITNMFKDALFAHRTFQHAEYGVSMFAPRLEIRHAQENKGHVLLRAKPLKAPPPVPEPAASRIVADFQAHFPLLDEVIDFIVHARFAADGRESFLWLNATAGAGKSFLMDAIFGKDGLALAAKIYMDDLKNIFKTQTSSFQVDDFLGKWILFIEEARGAPAVLKNINNTLPISPKYGFKSDVPLYAKILVSKDMPADLVEGGVEEQFADRISLVKFAPGKLADRPVFAENGPVGYAQALRCYAHARIADRMRELTAIGQRGAQEAAAAWLRGFHRRHAIAKEYGSMAAASADMLDTVLDEMRAAAAGRFFNNSGKDIPSRIPAPDDSRREHPGMRRALGADGTRYVAVNNVLKVLEPHLTDTKAKIAKSALRVQLQKRFETAGGEYTKRRVTIAHGGADGMPGVQSRNLLAWYFPVDALAALDNDNAEAPAATQSPPADAPPVASPITVPEPARQPTPEYIDFDWDKYSREQAQAERKRHPDSPAPLKPGSTWEDVGAKIEKANREKFGW